MKCILGCHRGTSRYCLCFGASKPILDCYTDANMVGDVDSRKSTFRYMMTFVEATVSWQSKLQKYVALSTTKAKYIAITKARKELLWIQKFLQKLGLNQEKYALHCDSQNTIHLSKNSTFHSRSNNNEMQYH